RGQRVGTVGFRGPERIEPESFGRRNGFHGVRGRTGGPVSEVVAELHGGQSIRRPGCSATACRARKPAAGTAAVFPAAARRAAVSRLLAGIRRTPADVA